MISRRLLSVSIALALAGMCSSTVFANVNSKKQLKTRRVNVSSQQTVVPTAADKGQAGESPDHPVPNHYTDEAITYFGGTPVVTSPYLGLRSEFDGSDLITNLSSMNEDLRLLMQRRAFDLELIKRGKRIPEFPLIELSGKIEAIATYQDPYDGPNTNDIDLATAEVDFAGYFSRSILGFMALKYDGSNGNFDRRVNNSRVFLDKAFVTWGDLNASPFYASAGQMYVPFGRYSGFMISSPLPLSIARVKERAVLVGFKQDGDNGAFGQAYYFKGDAIVSKQNNGGFNIGYDFSNPRFHGTVSTGIINNMADSKGMQDGGGAGFSGFAASDEDLVHHVHGYAINGKVSAGPISVVAEYVTALTRFDPTDLAYNGYGAKPSALDLEAAYMFKIHEHPTNIAVGYGRTKDALALNVPKERYTVAFNTSIWKDTIQSIEYSHDKNYQAGATAYGRGGDVPFPSAGLGSSGNMLTLQVGAYF